MYIRYESNPEAIFVRLNKSNLCIGISNRINKRNGALKKISVEQFCWFYKKTGGVFSFVGYKRFSISILFHMVAVLLATEKLD